jgi:hypothetical protein
MSDVDVSILLIFVLGVDGYKVGGFGESIHQHANLVELVGSQR